MEIGIRGKAGSHMSNGIPQQAQVVLCYRRVETAPKAGTYYKFRLFSGAGYAGECELFVPEGGDTLGLIDAIHTNLHEAITGIVTAVPK